MNLLLVDVKKSKIFLFNNVKVFILFYKILIILVLAYVRSFVVLIFFKNLKIYLQYTSLY